MDRRKINLEKVRQLPTTNELLDKKYGKVGSEKRAKFEAEALNFYASQIILHNRKEAKMTQKELAERSGINKSYISKIENGLIQPTFSTFLKIINAMGRGIEIV